MYKVTNRFKDVRKFRDGFLGKDIHVEPGKSVLTTRPPEENEVWKIEQVSEKSEEKKEGALAKEKKKGIKEEKPEEKNKINKMEDDEK